LLAKAKKLARGIRFWPPGSLKAAMLPFSIHLKTVTLLTPQHLATAPVVKNSGYNALWFFCKFYLSVSKNIPFFTPLTKVL
jgi:hypothetical protein